MFLDKFFLENLKKVLRRLSIPFRGDCCPGAKQVVQFNPETGKLETVSQDGTITIIEDTALNP